MDELRVRLKASTDALEAAEVPMSAGYAQHALELVTRASVGIHTVKDVGWWRRRRLRRGVLYTLDELEEEVAKLLGGPAPAAGNPGPEFA